MTGKIIKTNEKWKILDVKFLHAEYRAGLIMVRNNTKPYLTDPKFTIHKWRQKQKKKVLLFIENKKQI